MDIFFTTKRQYFANDSIDNIRADIESLINRKWYDLSVNMTGRFIDSNTFIITPKWSLAIIRWLETDLSYLKGTLSHDENGTLIETTLRPNSLFVIIFYFCALFSLSEPMRITNMSDGDPIIRFLFFPLFTLIIGLIILFSTDRMKTRFERHLNLNYYK